MPKKKEPSPNVPRLGKLDPRYRFFLNPYRDARFTYCPQCEQRMHARKEPFFVHVNPIRPVILNMTARYCPACDLVILHQDRVEELLAYTLQDKIAADDYMVMGTVERTFWRHRSERNAIPATLEQLHDFREVVLFEPAHYGWVTEEQAKALSRRRRSR